MLNPKTIGMLNNLRIKAAGITTLIVLLSSCITPTIMQKEVNQTLPESYSGSSDTSNTARLSWKEYFTDPNLQILIDSALVNNQELNIITQEIAISNNEIMAKKGEYLPFLNLRVGGGADKVARYTSKGAYEANTEIEPGKEMPEPVTDMYLGAYASWEIDIWGKLRNAKKSAVKRYLASVEGKNFMATNLIAEIANSYYELIALDSQLDIVKQNIELQSNALEVVKLQKESAKVTELAVRKFEAEVLNTQSLQYDIQQMIIEVENRINFLVGRFPQPVVRSYSSILDLQPSIINAGIPTQLLENRPDIKQAELVLSAAHLDVQSARANFYPSLGLTAGVGFEAYNVVRFIHSPESILFNIASDMLAPVVNRKAIKAQYFNANVKQIQAVYNYEQTVLNAFVEVTNQTTRIENYAICYNYKLQEVDALTASIDISTDLFKSARADYMEVLMTQRDALDAKFELVETKMKQMHAMVNVYRALGGGWF